MDLQVWFPRSIWPHLPAVSSIVPDGELAPSEPFTVRVDGELVQVPYRIYNPEPAVSTIGSLSPTQQAILACLYTRHHDGRVRQRHVRTVLRTAENWVAPFVVQLIGEYVIHIVETIRQELIDLDVPGSARRRIYGRFAAANPAFIGLTYQRAASYWNCYYRNRFTDRLTYPSFPLLSAIQHAAIDPAPEGRAPTAPPHSSR